MSHTPGPWEFYCDPEEWGAEDEPSVAWRIRAPGQLCDLMSNTRYYPHCPDEEGDWRLIAAAPDLLAALKVMINHYADVGSEHWNMADRAIAKAEGK